MIWRSLFLIMLLGLHPAYAQNPRKTGLLFLPSEIYGSIPLAVPPFIAELPIALDLSAKFPPAGDQGEQSSCAAWAVAYGLKTYQVVVKYGLDPNLRQNQFSPSALYNSIVDPSDCDGGIYLSEALEMLTNQGASHLSIFLTMIETAPNGQRSRLCLGGTNFE